MQGRNYKDDLEKLWNNHKSLKSNIICVFSMDLTSEKELNPYGMFSERTKHQLDGYKLGKELLLDWICKDNFNFDQFYAQFTSTDGYSTVNRSTFPNNEILQKLEFVKEKVKQSKVAVSRSEETGFVRKNNF